MNMMMMTTMMNYDCRQLRRPVKKFELLKVNKANVVCHTWWILLRSCYKSFLFWRWLGRFLWSTWFAFGCQWEQVDPHWYGFDICFYQRHVFSSCLFIAKCWTHSRLPHMDDIFFAFNFISVAKSFCHLISLKFHTCNFFCYTGFGKTRIFSNLKLNIYYSSGYIIVKWVSNELKSPTETNNEGPLTCYSLCRNSERLRKASRIGFLLSLVRTKLN